MSVRKLCFCALCVALAAVSAGMLKLYQFPFGGEVTLFSMLFAMLPAWLYGTGTGCLCGLVYGMLQFAMGPYVISPLQVLLDYVLAFSVMGVAGLVRNRRNGLLLGYSLAVLARWIVATLAGLVWVAAGSELWSGWAPLPYSAAYNGAYIFTEAALTLLVLCLPPVKRCLGYIRQQAERA